MTQSLTFQNYRAPYGLAEEFSMTLGGSKLVCVIGPNGSGKSTLLRSLCGLLKPTTGDILLNDISLSTLSPHTRSRQLAFLPQSPPLSNLWKVKEVISQGLTPYQHDPKRLIEANAALEVLYDQLKLKHLSERMVSQLSGGERRRVLIGRTLAQQTPITLLDEPLASLDWSHQEELMRVFKSLTRERKTLIILTIHELNLASLYADELIIISQGKLVGRGDPHSIFDEHSIRSAFKALPLLTKHPTLKSPVKLPHGPVTT